MTLPASPMRDILARTPFMPIVTIHDVGTASHIARALVDGGMTVFEVLLRTPEALDAIRVMAQAAPEAAIGAGTILSERQMLSALEAGATFGVSPGLTAPLARAAQSAGFPFLPGAASASEIMKGMEFGFFEQKFFPALGRTGIAFLKSVAGVFPQVTFCPTGGIQPEDVGDYLALPNCNIVGGAWVCPAQLVQAHDWASITELARQVSRTHKPG